MKTLRTPDRFVARCLGPQLIEEGLEYVESKYLIKEDGAIYNVLTDEAVLVEDLETDKPELIKRWFYVPSVFDVTSFSHTIRQKKLAAFNGPGYGKKYVYVIFTTTACNANCEYCFEKGIKTLSMDEQTALDVADYIDKTRDTSVKEIKLKWFGGEPLVNKKAMTLICSRLKQKDIRFWSEICTNGDLVNECTDQELLDIWKTRRIQFTVDDIGAEYDRVKGLGNGAYERLKKIVERLDKLPIRQAIRIHFDPSKGAERCYRVINEFKRYFHTRIYPRVLYGNESLEANIELLKIEDYIMQNKKYDFTFPIFNYTTRCMADNRKIACICPDGSLSPCEHYAYGNNIYGSIYSKEYDKDILKRWSVKEKYVTKKCKDCVLYPMCRKITTCPVEGKCNEAYVHYQVETIKRALRKKVSELYGGDSNTNN